MKTETLEEFLARGGQIKKVTTHDNHYVDNFALSKPNIKNNKEAYFKFVKRGKEIKK